MPACCEDFHIDFEVCSFRPGLWLGASLGYDLGGQSTIDGDKKNDSREVLS